MPVSTTLSALKLTESCFAPKTAAGLAKEKEDEAAEKLQEAKTNNPPSAEELAAEAAELEAAGGIAKPLTQPPKPAMCLAFDGLEYDVDWLAPIEGSEAAMSLEEAVAEEEAAVAADPADTVAAAAVARREVSR